MMDKLQRDAVLITLIEELKNRGSWCGETHIQKSTYFLQELAGVDMEFDFILYKHGPFSFELADELASMKADELLKTVVQPAPYGPSLLPTGGAGNLKARYPKTLGRYSLAVAYVAGLLGSKGVADLERLATALYVTRELAGCDLETRSRRIEELKPHVRHEDAIGAVMSVDEWIGQAKEALA